MRALSRRLPAVRYALSLGMLPAAIAFAGCGGSSDASQTLGDRPAPPPSTFPAADGASLRQLYSHEATPDNQVQAAVSGRAFEVGRSRFGFGLFSVSGQQITDDDVALYARHGATGPMQGPYPASVKSLETEPAFRAKTTTEDPDSAKAVYVANVKFDKPGRWDVIALIDRDDGYHSTVVGSVVAGGSQKIPQVGQRAPVVHTPTAQDVADLGAIDTRVPHDTMHQVDLADALGKRPVVLVFATPALCQSRVCGPVVDVAEQVQSEFSDSDVAFIHMEVYNDNNPSEGYRPQLRAYHLRTEPWLFVMNRKGVITTRIEGAFGVSELEQAVREVAR